MNKKGFLRGLVGSKKQDGCCGGKIVAPESAEVCGCSDANYNDLIVKILGSGCKNCTILADNTTQALKQLGLQAKIEKVTDFAKITAYGVMSTPALVVNEKVVSYGKVLRPEEISQILQQSR